jgi:hypothetical protein
MRVSRTIVALTLCLLPLVAAAGEGDPGILPEGAVYDSTVPTPAQVLGQEIGRWHLRHDQLIDYFAALADASDRVTLEVQGLTHENRQLLVATVTSPDNHARLEQIRQRHLELSDPQAPTPTDEELADLPIVVYLGYSIHGNEASGSNAAPLVAYHLAASQDPEIQALLEESVILIDPSLNPDGMGRFASWANMHRGVHAVADADHREHQEGWPSGRTNHYWFDLNRDWLLLQHPESRARVKTFHRWKPNLLGDYHEMGSNSTYFFQPGVVTREHPLKPERNLELTRAIAEFHARNLESDGQLFYSGESFDDFYPGKGSTYPDLNGSVGVLFEQASARGHVQETVNGDLEFARAIKNHFLTSLSMVEGARHHRLDLLRYQVDFPRRGLTEARRDPVGAYVFSCPRDLARCAQMIDVLLAHEIEVHRLGTGFERDGRAFDPAWSWVVPMEQPQYRLAKALFERRTEFEDSIFYDISTWTLPLAFGAFSAEIDRRSTGAGLLGERLAASVDFGERFEAIADSYAYVFDWDSYFAPRALNRLLQEEHRVRVATRRFQATTPSGVRDFDFGAIVVPVGVQDDRQGLEDLLSTIAREDGVEIWPVLSGLTPEGVDLGSPNVYALEPVRPLLVVGGTASSYEAGEAWHLLDHRFGITTSLVEGDQLGRIDLGDYTHVLMVNGRYSELGESETEALKEWIEGGGVLVATKGGAVWTETAILGIEEKDEAEEPEAPAEEERPRRYVDYEQERAVEYLSGAIFEVELDPTHPIAFGYREESQPVFRNSTLILTPSDNPYEVVARYPGEPLLSGYVSPGNLAEIAGSDAVIATRLGAGTVVRIADNPNFRGFWYGTSKLYLNPIFFGSVVKRTSSPSDW